MHGCFYAPIPRIYTDFFNNSLYKQCIHLCSSVEINESNCHECTDVFTRRYHGFTQIFLITLYANNVFICVPLWKSVRVTATNARMFLRTDTTD